MKPISASEILRKSAPRETLGQSFAHVNRFDRLQDISPAPSTRDRTDSFVSQKRKDREDCDSDTGDTYNKNKVSRYEEDEELELTLIESRISKVSTLCGKLTTEVQQQQLEVDEKVRSFLADIVEAIRETNEVQTKLLSLYKGKEATGTNGGKSRENPSNTQVTYSSVAASGSGLYNVANPGKAGAHRARRNMQGGLVAANSDERGNFSRNNAKDTPTETEEEKLQRKFSEAIKDAERSTLCFNLNMGNVPIMNKATISEKASLALTKMAAVKEGKSSSVPSPDSVAAIDDVTSLVTKMEFFGSSTKQYKGKDAGTFCTVPVKYQFRDKDQRIFAEKTLRDTCAVKCATPYPAIVRECIKQVIDHVRISHPEDYVKVTVSVKDFSLKASRRPQGKDRKWIEYPDLLRLPDEAWDVSAKKVPEGLRMFYLPEEITEEMLVSPGAEKQFSPTKSRRVSSGKK
jgi:hypothetical protein